MTTYGYDPKTGKRLTRAGFAVNAVQPMTQEEVDRQCAMVSEDWLQGRALMKIREELFERLDALCTPRAVTFRTRLEDAKALDKCVAVIVDEVARIYEDNGNLMSNDRLGQLKALAMDKLFRMNSPEVQAVLDHVRGAADPVELFSLLCDQLKLSCERRSEEESATFVGKFQHFMRCLCAELAPAELGSEPEEMLNNLDQHLSEFTEKCIDTVQQGLNANLQKELADTLSTIHTVKQLLRTLVCRLNFYESEVGKCKEQLEREVGKYKARIEQKEEGLRRVELETADCIGKFVGQLLNAHGMKEYLSLEFSYDTWQAMARDLLPRVLQQQKLIKRLKIDCSARAMERREEQRLQDSIRKALGNVGDLYLQRLVMRSLKDSLPKATSVFEALELLLTAVRELEKRVWAGTSHADGMEQARGHVRQGVYKFLPSQHWLIREVEDSISVVDLARAMSKALKYAWEDCPPYASNQEDV